MLNDQQNKKALLVSFALGVLLCLFGCVFSYLCSTGDRHYDNTTVQRIEDGNRRIGDELEDIRAKLQFGQEAVTRAEERVGDLQESNVISSERHKESRKLIERSRELFEDIDRANGLDETQTTGEGTTE